MSAKNLLIQARDFYAASPSHAPTGEIPIIGTYCVLTALDEANYDSKVNASNKDYFVAENAIADVISPARIMEYNATHSTEKVLEVFDKAIAAAL